METDTETQPNIKCSLGSPVEEGEEGLKEPERRGQGHHRNLEYFEKTLGVLE